jgi:pyruvate dehydrogenase E2 component (dihydrolipoamide acetyltransferase)
VPLPPAERGAPVPAGPATRRLARELGVDLHEVRGSGRGGRVTVDDVKAFVRSNRGRPAPSAPAVGGVAVPPLPDFSKYGPVERKPFSGLRKAIARNLTVSWTVAPQVTQHDLADITELEAGRKRFVEAAGKGTPKVTMTAIVIKACVAALKQFPHFNASYDPAAGENGELVVKKYYHLGVAVDTERGLVVPVIRDADKKSVLELAREVGELAEKARAGKLGLEEMKGGTFTITNLGGIGGTAFSPILNYPEVAILGLSRSSLQPVVRDGKVEPRLMLPLSLTYDHRVIDGADGARFAARLAQLLGDPTRLLLEG